MPKVSVVEGLEAARALIARSGGWTQGVLSRDRHGAIVDYCHAGAVAWCAYGAIFKVSGHQADFRIASLLKKAAGTGFLEAWNDEPGRTQADVVAAFDRAIELARAEP